MKDFNDQLKAVFEKYPNLPPSNIYATQMTWLQPLSKKTQVWAMRGAMRSHAKGNECRFSLTCLLTAFADNTYLDPFFIVKGKTCSPDWVSDPLMVASLRLAGSIRPGHRPKKARTESFTQWAELVFMPMTTARRSAETPMMLLMDNHGSHRTISSGYATETSRKGGDLSSAQQPTLQGLDVTIMLPFRVYGDIAVTHYRKVEVTSAKKRWT